MTIAYEEKANVIDEYALKEAVTGSPEVQVALLTYRINKLNSHFTEHRADHHSRRGLISMVNLRRKLLAYLKSKDHQRYLSLIGRLKLRK